MTIAPPPAATEPLDVAALVRAASADDHRAAETRGFITALMGGELSLDEYTRYLAQLAWVYDALEERGSRPGDPAVFDPALARMAAIDADLAALGASGWREAHPPLPATADYAAHLRSIADDDVRYLAHHYTRYLGDLSGGQAIAALVARHYGATPEQLGFYRFEVADDGVARYKRTAFRMNSAVFEALAG